jgi:hypothetical protein
MPLSPFTIWSNPERSRPFLLRGSATLPAGSFTIGAPLRGLQKVNPDSLPLFELSEHQATGWVASEITGILESIPRELSSTGQKILAADHLAGLPTLPQARESGSQLDQMLAAGIESHSATAHLPDRIDAIPKDPAALQKRREIEAERPRLIGQIEIPSVDEFLQDISAEIRHNISKVATGRAQKSPDHMTIRDQFSQRRAFYVGGFGARVSANSHRDGREKAVRTTAGCRIVHWTTCRQEAAPHDLSLAAPRPLRAADATPSQEELEVGSHESKEYICRY